MQLSDRLQAVASMVTENSRLADVEQTTDTYRFIYVRWERSRQRLPWM